MPAGLPTPTMKMQDDLLGSEGRSQGPASV
jgi:hypothetical protein